MVMKKRTSIVLVTLLMFINGFVILDAFASVRSFWEGCPCCCMPEESEDETSEIQLNLFLKTLMLEELNCIAICEGICEEGQCEWVYECPSGYDGFEGFCKPQEEDRPYCTDGYDTFTLTYGDCPRSTEDK